MTISSVKITIQVAWLSLILEGCLGFVNWVSYIEIALVVVGAMVPYRKNELDKVFIVSR